MRTFWKIAGSVLLWPGPKLMGDQGRVPPSKRLLVRNFPFLSEFVICRFTSARVVEEVQHRSWIHWREMIKSLKNHWTYDKFYRYLSIVLGAMLGCKLWLNFGYLGINSIIWCIDLTHVPTTVVVAVVADSVVVDKFGSLPPPLMHLWLALVLPMTSVCLWRGSKTRRKCLNNNTRLCFRWTSLQKQMNA